MTTPTTIEMIPIKNLKPSDANPRKRFDAGAIEGLAQSIRADGLLQNLVAAKPEGRKRTYFIVSGERRYHALQHLIAQGDLPESLSVPVEVREGLSGEDALRIATVENIQREDLSPLEEAGAIKVLAHDGEKLEDIAAQTGLSDSTIKRRLVLLSLSETVKDALTEGRITLSQAEALSVGNHAEQDDHLPRILNGCYSKAADIKESILGSAPSLALAIFDKEEYTGSFRADLLAEDETTYFDDTAQFFELQKAAAQKLVAQYEQENDWAELVEGHFMSFEYREAGEGESGGVVVSLTPEGKVEVHENLVRRNIDQSVSEAMRSKPKAAYGKSPCEYIAMHKSAAVQAELIANPRKAKEITVADMLYRRAVHGCYAYLERQGEAQSYFDIIKLEARALNALLNIEEMSDPIGDLLFEACSAEQAYELVKRLDDDGLQRLLVFLTALKFGQTNTEQLDTREDSLFNQVALSLGTDMRRYWQPSSWFLCRRTMEQLGEILKESGLSRLYGNGKGYKKKDLVPMMLRYFTKVANMSKPDAQQIKARDWLPGVFEFPAVDPDAKDAQDETELSEAA